MITNVVRPEGSHSLIRHLITMVCAILLVPGNLPVSARQAQQAAQPQQPTNVSAAGEAQQPAQQGATISPDQLDSLVAPIALFPDQLLSQTLVASTYPLEIMQLQQWLEKNKGLQGQALVDAVSKQPWDPSIQAMAALPDMVKRLADDIQWTTDLGNAFLAQQGDVMDAIQRMRKRAESQGTLASNEHQKVQTQEEGGRSVVVIEQANPEVVYVPSYNPEAVYGAAVYPYPAIAYPSYGGVLAASAISWGVGVAMGAAWGGGWGWGAGWGNNEINVNRNNNFNRNTAVANRAAGNNWRHNPTHRGGAPYSNRATANRFGSNARGDSLASRQKGAQQQIARQKGNLGSARAGGGGGLANRPGGGNLGGARTGAGARTGGADRVGNRSAGSGFSRGNGGGFGSGGFSGGSARASRSRGSSSFSGRSGGGGRGGGGRGGGGRGGGRR